MKRKSVCWALLTGALVLLRTPSDTHARTPQDGNQDIMILSQRNSELKDLIEKTERTLHVERGKARQQPQAEKAREAMQEAQQAYQKLIASEKNPGAAQRAAARERITAAHQAYKDTVENTLQDNPDTATLLQNLKKYKAERKRIAYLLKRIYEQKR